MILPLLHAIYSTFTANETLATAFPGGMGRDTVPPGTAMPYIVSEVVGGPLTDAYGNAISSDITIIFKAVGGAGNSASGHDLTYSAIKAFIDAFDDTLLTLTGATNYSMRRIGEPIPVKLEEDASGGGKDVWQWSVIYEFSVN